MSNTFTGTLIISLYNNIENKNKHRQGIHEIVDFNAQHSCQPIFIMELYLIRGVLIHQNAYKQH